MAIELGNEGQIVGGLLRAGADYAGEYSKDRDANEKFNRMMELERAKAGMKSGKPYPTNMKQQMFDKAGYTGIDASAVDDKDFKDLLPYLNVKPISDEQRAYLEAGTRARNSVANKNTEATAQMGKAMNLAIEGKLADAYAEMTKAVTAWQLIAEMTDDPELKKQAIDQMMESSRSAFMINSALQKSGGAAPAQPAQPVQPQPQGVGPIEIPRNADGSLNIKAPWKQSVKRSPTASPTLQQAPGVGAPRPAPGFNPNKNFGPPKKP